MTRKQQTLVLHRSRDVFSSSELHRIHLFIDAVATEDIMGRPQAAKVAFDYNDRRVFVNSIINAEKFRHGVLALGKPHLEPALEKEKLIVMEMCKKYGF